MESEPIKSSNAHLTNGDTNTKDGGGSFKIKSRLRLGSPAKLRLTPILELLILFVWALFIGQPYLNFDPHVFPAGREFGSAIQTHNIWIQFQKCGWCALWNGDGQGGYPSFVDTHGSMLHPIVMVTTLLWGLLKGAKISLIITFWIGGIAQWWIARELKIGWLPRMWSAAMAMASGHLAGRMEMGVFGVMFSTAMTSLIFGAVMNVSSGKGRRPGVLLGIVIASAILSGQGYLQVGVLFLFPTILILIFGKEQRSQKVEGNYILGSVLGVLLAAPFLVPLVHFLPNFAKFMDPEFASAQSLVYTPLNLVIHDADFYRSEILDKFSFPYLYTLFVGWIPVILAIIGFGMKKPNDRRYLWFLLCAIMIEFFTASALPLKWLVGIIPALAGIRQPSLIAGLAIPPILGLAAYGLDQLLNLDWPTLWINFSEQISIPRWKISLKLLLIIPLVFSLQRGYTFTIHWTNTNYIGAGIFELLDSLKTDNMQWVNPPFGEHYYLITGIDKGLKLSPGIRAWQWKDRELPIPSLEAIRGLPPDDIIAVTTVDQVGIYERPGEHYAAVQSVGSQQPCAATGAGGKITVDCENTESGKLVVKENIWMGWKAWMDGKRVSLVGRQWLEVNAPPGKHTYQFLYRPWDVPLGLFFSFIGVVACVYLWFIQPKQEASPVS